MWCINWKAVLSLSISKYSLKSFFFLQPTHNTICCLWLNTFLSIIFKTRRILNWNATVTVQYNEVAQLCPNLCNHVDRSPPGSSVHGILQAKVLEWVAISFSRGSSQPRDRTRVSHIAGRCFILWAAREAPNWNAREYQIAKTHTMETTVTQDLALSNHQYHSVQDVTSKQQTK